MKIDLSPFSYTAVRVGFGVLSLLAVATVWWILGQPQHVGEPELRPEQRLQCVSYAPFRKGESPWQLDAGLRFEPARIHADLALLAQRFNCIRTYSVFGMDAVPDIARELGLKVLLGAWVNTDMEATRRELDGAVALANHYPDTVAAVIVGNEVLLRRELEGPELAALIRETKARVQQPVTYADVWEFWLKHPQVGDVTDFVTIHILPYWEDEPVSVSRAIAHVANVRAEVVAQLGHDNVLIGETGWPSHGRMREGALPSPHNQAQYLRAFVRLAHQQGWRYNLIEGFDQPWKRQLEGAVGGYWGLYDTQRHDKHVLSGAVTAHPNWPILAGVSAVCVLGLYALAWPSQRRSPGLLISFGVATVLSGCALSLQLEQYLFEASGYRDWLWAVIILSSLAVFCLQTLRSLMRAEITAPSSLRATLSAFTTGKWRGALDGIATVAVCTVATIIALGLVFDPRYRSFPAAGFLLAAVLFATRVVVEIRRRVGLAGDQGGCEEQWLGVVLMGCAFATAIIETTANWQAMLWCAACLLLGLGLSGRAWLGRRLASCNPQQC